MESEQDGWVRVSSRDEGTAGVTFDIQSLEDDFVNRTEALTFTASLDIKLIAPNEKETYYSMDVSYSLEAPVIEEATGELRTTNETLTNATANSTETEEE